MMFEWTEHRVEGLALAIETAIKAHGVQLDKANEPYIFHSLRVMLKVPSTLKRVAVLHDVNEDTDYSLADLNFLSAEEIRILDLLTRKKDQLHRTYIELIGLDEQATIVKIEDLNDNMSPERLKNLPKKYHSLMDRYSKAHAFLTNSLKSRRI